MKRFLYLLVFSFIISGMAFAIEYQWITLKGNNKSVDITNIVVNLDKLDNEVMGYIVRTHNNNGYLITGVGALCYSNPEENKVAIIASQQLSNSYNQNMEQYTEPKYEKPKGTIKLTSDYVCNRYFLDRANFDKLEEEAKMYKENSDYTNAIEKYKLALIEAKTLTTKGYSQKREANILFDMAEIYEIQKKYKLAKECYISIQQLDKLKDLSIKEKATKKLTELPEIKGEKAKEAAGNVLKGVGALGLGAMSILLGN